MTVVYFPFYSTAIFKVLICLCFMGLQWQDVCLQSKLLMWYFTYMTFFVFFLQYLFFSEPAENEYVVSGGCFSLQDIAKS